MVDNLYDGDGLPQYIQPIGILKTVYVGTGPGFLSLMNHHCFSILAEEVCQGDYSCVPRSKCPIADCKQEENEEEEEEGIDLRGGLTPNTINIVDTSAIRLLLDIRPFTTMKISPIA